MSADAKILVVDDEPHIRRILQFLLQQEGFEVVLAENGEEALAYLGQEMPDLVLLDVMMPRMDGYSVLQEIRKSYETRNLPVVMLTAKGESAEKVRGLKGGANDYLTKPFNQEELLLRMHNMLEASKAQREANPLTGLPGNRAIERECLDRLKSDEPFGFMYLDIDRFKGFNDNYGYSRGDEAISYLAGILRQCSSKDGPNQDFIGHVGGDDFVLFTESGRAEALAKDIIDAFDAGIESLHDTEDFKRGYLCVETRAGVEEKIPLITLTVALVVDAQGRFQHPAQLSDLAAELKRYGKTLVGSVVVKERRSPDGVPELVPSSKTEKNPA
jgi:diguanylate cyclase (GGDEF)-like protein